MKIVAGTQTRHSMSLYCVSDMSFMLKLRDASIGRSIDVNKLFISVNRIYCNYLNMTCQFYVSHTTLGLLIMKSACRNVKVVMKIFIALVNLVRLSKTLHAPSKFYILNQRKSIKVVVSHTRKHYL